jgi:hypothetical protein
MTFLLDKGQPLPKLGEAFFIGHEMKGYVVRVTEFKRFFRVKIG